MDPANLCRALHAEIFYPAHQVKELLLLSLSEIRKYKVRSWLRLISLHFGKWDQGTDVFLVCSFFKFFGVIIVQFDICTPLTLGCHPEPPPRRAWLSQISERRVEMFECPRGGKVEMNKASIHPAPEPQRQTHWMVFVIVAAASGKRVLLQEQNQFDFD